MDLLHDKWYKVVPCGNRVFAVTEVSLSRTQQNPTKPSIWMTCLFMVTTAFVVNFYFNVDLCISIEGL